MACVDAIWLGKSDGPASFGLNQNIVLFICDETPPHLASCARVHRWSGSSTQPTQGFSIAEPLRHPLHIPNMLRSLSRPFNFPQGSERTDSSVSTPIAASAASEVVARPSDSPFRRPACRAIPSSPRSRRVPLAPRRRAKHSESRVPSRESVPAPAARGQPVHVFDEFASGLRDPIRQFLCIAIDSLAFVADAFPKSACKLFADSPKARSRRPAFLVWGSRQVRTFPALATTLTLRLGPTTFLSAAASVSSDEQTERSDSQESGSVASLELSVTEDSVSPPVPSEIAPAPDPSRLPAAAHPSGQAVHRHRRTSARIPLSQVTQRLVVFSVLIQKTLIGQPVLATPMCTSFASSASLHSCFNFSHSQGQGTEPSRDWESEVGNRTDPQSPLPM